MLHSKVVLVLTAVDGTANFTSMIYDLFDIFNIRTPVPKHYKSLSKPETWDCIETMELHYTTTQQELSIIWNVHVLKNVWLKSVIKFLEVKYFIKFPSHVFDLTPMHTMFHHTRGMIVNTSKEPEDGIHTR